MSEGRQQIAQLLDQIEREAYNRGYAEAIAAVTAAANAAAPKHSEAVQPESPFALGGGNSAASAVPVRGRGRPSTAIIKVREAIFEKPGMKGVELVRYLEQRGTPVLERTVRSCLRRLKNETARQRRGRWYPMTEPGNSNGEALAAPPH